MSRIVIGRGADRDRESRADGGAERILRRDRIEKRVGDAGYDRRVRGEVVHCDLEPDRGRIGVDSQHPSRRHVEDRHTGRVETHEAGGLLALEIVRARAEGRPEQQRGSGCAKECGCAEECLCHGGLLVMNRVAREKVERAIRAALQRVGHVE